MTYFLAVGCSHTAGVGIKPDEIYVEQLSKLIEIPCVNLSKSGSNSEYALKQIVETVQQESLPNFIIAQWPNIYRKQFWTDSDCFFENVNTGGEIFNKLLKQSENNFIKPWVQNIITANVIADAFDIPIYHIYLDYTDIKLDKNIKLHQDLKKPGETWLFDSAASDGLHHSAMCHRAWADRLIGIINENTKR